ncbi:uncharacterized protein B0H64DRAFT_135886 [Chaetomium fimeti]|uniref:Uncharacterized protein n=1 Tax=Chaetomium fimeti TaxID=1854472 RepID=A0AAE0HKM5_9PEZI|nr:hypothetical protein B0H64DRAFT_135886 [Chaetomium fimeti]
MHTNSPTPRPLSVILTTPTHSHVSEPDSKGYLASSCCTAVMARRGWNRQQSFLIDACSRWAKHVPETKGRTSPTGELFCRACPALAGRALPSSALGHPLLVFPFLEVPPSRIAKASPREGALSHSSIHHHSADPRQNGQRAWRAVPTRRNRCIRVERIKDQVSRSEPQDERTAKSRYDPIGTLRSRARHAHRGEQSFGWKLTGTAVN